MTPLDQKINQHFQGLVVRKDLVKTVKGNSIVPFLPDAQLHGVFGNRGEAQGCG